MTDLVVEYADLQALHQSTAGARVRSTTAVAQVVTTVVAARIRSTYATVQVVHQGSDGALARVSNTTPQVVWTTGASAEARQRAWTFDLDGHTFYVLDLGPTGALVYDLTTQQWSKFVTEGFSGHWNFKNGFDWRDGRMIVGGFEGAGTLLKLTPTAFLDEGWRPVVYEVRGILAQDSIDFLRQYSLRLVGSAGVLADSIAPVLNMQFSDDRGETWSDEYSITLTTNTKQRIEFRSLGAFTSPGRIFRLYDEGGVKYIALVQAEIGGENGRLPA